MRRFILLMLTTVSVTTVQAQLEVDANGDVKVGNVQTPVMSDMNTTFYTTHSVSSTGKNIAIVGATSNNTGNSNVNNTGVLGYASNSSLGISHGVWGMIQNSYGASIYGTIGNPLINITGVYAGCFVGPVYTYGNITASSFLSSSDYNLKENIRPFEENGEDALSKVMNMNVVEYNYKNMLPEQESKEGGDEVFEKLNKEDCERLHFGLIAQELQDIYPNLVVKGQDDYLRINYVELVPVLIQSIKELKAQLDELQGNPQVKSRAATADYSIAEGVRTSKLFQNTPNPSKGATTIKFVLGDNVQSACISIFDMQGKAIKNIPLDNGMESITVSASEIGYGMFLYSLVADGYEIDTKRMILTK